MWLAPVQVKLLTISERFVDYGKEVYQKLRDAGLRAEFDKRDDKISFKIRAASKEKIPYLLIVGAKEQEDGTVTVRDREDQKNQTAMSVDEFITKALGESEMDF